ncbi:isoamyl acetate-hydrolyzing esterase 1 homolog [Asterias rubens]|uniref:isoamyl acetate-hydrolyzing esterase 1 homolog n=1 Tax=Asterias rubens TaxID=7604 RepID=UPI0014557C6A|nr:isoamyl acetate-hydrolyzing esterase 1 homolog [Asterias rubens]
MALPKVVLFGDSITQFSFEEGGWGAALANTLQRKCDVVMRGFSGYNTRWAKLILERCVPKEMLSEVVMATVFLGANDAGLKESSVQFVPLEDYSENLKAIVKYFQEGGLKPSQIILITPPPTDDVAWDFACREKYGSPGNRLNANTGKYAEVCSSVAQEAKTGLLDLWKLMQEDKSWKRFLSDGLHFSVEGSKFVSKHLNQMVLAGTEHLPMILPDWKDVDVSCPEKSLYK